MAQKVFGALAVSLKVGWKVEDNVLGVLPVPPLDGPRAVEALMCPRMPLKRPHKEMVGTGTCV